MKHSLLCGLIVLLSACAAPTGTVDGFFRIDGQDAKLSFSRAGKGEPYMKYPTIDVAFSEKNSSTAKDVSSISFGSTYGNLISITLYKTDNGSYDVISSSFRHPAQKVSGGGSGIVEVKDVKEADGEISGELYTKPGTTMFDQKIDIDLKFKAPLPK